MFTVDEFQLIKKRCLSELEKFLKKISIQIPNFDNADEFKIYEKLGSEITNKMCRLLKSNSIVEGYTKLLKLGNISYDFSETDDELLKKIIDNKEKILQSSTVEKCTQSLQMSCDFNIKISHSKNFDVTDLVEKIKQLENLLDNSHEYIKVKIGRLNSSELREYPKNFSAMKNIISQIIYDLKSLELVQVEKNSTVVSLENLTEKIQEYSTAFIEIKKFSQSVKETDLQKIIFTTTELENIFEVLEQANKISKSI